MRTVFVDCKTIKQARKLCPWAFIIHKVDGGYRCFESPDDFMIWTAQK